MINKSKVNSMNYKNIYERLMLRARDRGIEGYQERHHIVPRCLGGSDDAENLVRLTPEEHYLAHQLLVRIYPNNHSLVKAAMMMTVNRPSNKIYGWLRRRFAEAQSIGQKGDKNSQFRTKWIYNVALKECRKISEGESIPVGWLRGRVINFDDIERKESQRQAVRFKKNLEKHLQKKQLAQEWYRKFLDSGASSIRAFVRTGDYTKSHVSFIKMLKTYVPEFAPEHGKAFIP